MKIQAPQTQAIQQILPHPPSLLMGAGPVPVPPEVAKANSMVINHIGETMNMVTAGFQKMAQYVFQTSGQKIFAISGPSSAAMEMAVTSLLWPGRTVLVCNLGTFSARFAELAHAVGATVIQITPKEFGAFTVEEVKQALQTHQVDVMTIVQGETSCGMINKQLPGIVAQAKLFGVRVILDAVSTLSSVEMNMDEWGLDVVVCGGQKGLSSVAGVSLIAYSEDCYEFVANRIERMPHWCLDPRRAYRFWGLKEYHYTAPVSGILALYEALRLVVEETLERRFERHCASSLKLQNCLEIMGLELYAPRQWRLNTVVAIKNPAGVNTKELFKFMVQNHGVEISGAFGLDIIRIGQMGEQCRPMNLRRVIEAVGLGYKSLGVKLDVASALAQLDAEISIVA